jgi:hypothetical protein
LRPELLQPHHDNSTTAEMVMINSFIHEASFIHQQNITIQYFKQQFQASNSLLSLGADKTVGTLKKR